jgi:hypothetical protein
MLPRTSPDDVRDPNVQKRRRTVSVHNSSNGECLRQKNDSRRTAVPSKDWNSPSTINNHTLAVQLQPVQARPVLLGGANCEFAGELAGAFFEG